MNKITVNQDFDFSDGAVFEKFALHSPFGTKAATVELNTIHSAALFNFIAPYKNKIKKHKSIDSIVYYDGVEITLHQRVSTFYFKD